MKLKFKSRIGLFFFLLVLVGSAPFLIYLFVWTGLTLAGLISLTKPIEPTPFMSKNKFSPSPPPKPKRHQTIILCQSHQKEAFVWDTPERERVSFTLHLNDKVIFLDSFKKEYGTFTIEFFKIQSLHGPIGWIDSDQIKDSKASPPRLREVRSIFFALPNDSKIPVWETHARKGLSLRCLQERRRAY